MHKLIQHFHALFAQPPLDDFPDFLPSEPLHMQYHFSGTVQGVGFRRIFYRYACHLGLVGFVKNLPDGRVVAQVQGERDRILALIERMYAHAQIEITQLDRANLPLDANLQTFSIR